eukprot:Pompholyxophrys_punicea_v1_NODE_1384_length_748_cov_2.287157.p1 type:complete len:181 gc:universal NODE_1384_length_748_cov_2.287157:177-719(+)
MNEYRIESNDKILEMILKKFRQIYFLCQNELPLNLYADLELNDSYSGFEDVLTANNCKYTSHDFVNEAVECSSTFVKSKVLSQIWKGEKYVGVIIDESMDISVTSQLIIYYRFTGADGKANVVFGGLEALKNGTADTISQTLLGRLEKDSIPLDFVCSFGSDGASVMLRFQWSFHQNVGV